jgi:hypothetical protein
MGLNMKKDILICLAALLLIMPPVMAQETTNKNCLPKISFDLGDIGKQKFSIIHNGTLNLGDLSWFKFTVVEPSKFFITILDPVTRFAFLVYDKDMNYVTSGWDPLVLNLPAGTYYVRLDISWYESTNYTLLASNWLEAEPNDGLSEANDIGTISVKSTLCASIDPAGDIDFFKFKVADDQGGLLKITPTNLDNKMILVLYGYNQSQKRYLPEASGGTLSVFVAPGTYYLRVEDMLCKDSSYIRVIRVGGGGSQDSSYNYALNLSLSQITCDKEPNDSFAQAKSMGTLNASAALLEKGCISSNDVDYFQFDVLENMSVTVKTITDGDTFICLYDSNEQSLDCNDDYYGLSSRIDRELRPGNYYVKVGGYGGGEVFAYELSVSREENEAQIAHGIINPVVS